MIWVAWAGAGTLVTLFFYQSLFTAYFVFRFLAWRPKSLEKRDYPKVEVWMSLRGSDPELANNLRGLLSQSYPNYRLRIIVDGVKDRAWDTVQQVVQENPSSRVTVSVLENRLRTCSLKCSAMAQLAKDLDKDTEVVVLADGDIVAHSEWLSQLIVPFEDQNIGIVTGNRWFVPTNASLGSCVRYLWNSAAMVPTYIFANSWGGSCAIRARILRETDLQERWTRSAVEDATLKSAAKSLGLKSLFVPGIMMINREDCSLQFAFRFISRMFTWSRLYESGFFVTILHSLISSLAILSALVCFLVGLATNHSLLISVGGGGLAIYHLGNVLLCFLIEYSVRRAIRQGGQAPATWLTPRAFLTLIIALPLLEILYPITVLKAWTCRRVMWRGIEYEINGPYDIRLCNDSPLQTDADGTNHSI